LKCRRRRGCGYVHTLFFERVFACGLSRSLAGNLAIGKATLVLLKRFEFVGEDALGIALLGFLSGPFLWRCDGRARRRRRNRLRLGWR
jgi:hypothetical protein